MYELPEYKVYEKNIDSKDLLPYQLEIWRIQLGFYVDLGQKFCNPFRSDKKPSCFLYEYNGIIHLFDIGKEFHGWTIFHTIPESSFQRKCQYIYYELLPKINVPLDKLFYQKTIKKERAKINWKTRTFSRVDREFWCYGGITERQLMNENLNPLRYYVVNNHKIYPQDITYGYNIKEGKKVYRPYNKNYKWTSNMTIEHIGGNQQINHEKFQPKSIIITKSLKDYCVICNMGYNCRYIINEGADLTVPFLRFLDKNFDFVFFCMDNDNGGVKAIQKYQEMWQSIIGNDKFYSLEIPVQEHVTDIFDLAKHTSFSNSEYIINKQIEEIYDSKFKESKVSTTYYF